MGGNWPGKFPTLPHPHGPLCHILSQQSPQGQVPTGCACSAASWVSSLSLLRTGQCCRAAAPSFLHSFPSSSLSLTSWIKHQQSTLASGSVSQEAWAKTGGHKKSPEKRVFSTALMDCCPNLRKRGYKDWSLWGAGNASQTSIRIPSAEVAQIRIYEEGKGQRGSLCSSGQQFCRTMRAQSGPEQPVGRSSPAIVVIMKNLHRKTPRGQQGRSKWGGGTCRFQRTCSEELGRSLSEVLDLEIWEKGGMEGRLKVLKHALDQSQLLQCSRWGTMTNSIVHWPATALCLRGGVTAARPADWWDAPWPALLPAS